MSNIDLQLIKSSTPTFSDTLIVRSLSHTIIIDPALNHKAILANIKPKEIAQKSCELWLSSCHMQSGPYINELSQTMNIPVYAPYNFLPHYRKFPQTAKTVNLCGVYQPKIKADLIQHARNILSDELKVYSLSSSIAIHFIALKQVWYQAMFLSLEDRNTIDNLKLKIL